MKPNLRQIRNSSSQRSRQEDPDAADLAGAEDER